MAVSGSGPEAAKEHPEAFVAAMRELTRRYPARRGALLPILTALQARRGHLATGDLRLAAELTGLSPAEVFSIATFYTMYRLQPAGRFPIGVCRNISCWVNGSERLVATIRDELAIGPGERTADGAFSLAEVECLGSCENAPCLEIESRYFERVTPGRLRELLRELRESALDPDAAVAAAQRTR